MKKHKQVSEKKIEGDLATILATPFPTLVQKVEVILSPEGNLKITIEKEQVGTDDGTV